MDDILVYGTSQEQFDHYLKEASITLKIEKCQFFKTFEKFLDSIRTGNTC